MIIEIGLVSLIDAMLLRNVLFLVTVVCAIRTRSRLGEQIDCTNYDNGDKETLLLTFTCISKSNFNSVRINCEKIPAYVTSWPCEAALRIKEDEKVSLSIHNPKNCNNIHRTVFFVCYLLFPLTFLLFPTSQSLPPNIYKYINI